MRDPRPFSPQIRELVRDNVLALLAHSGLSQRQLAARLSLGNGTMHRITQMSSGMTVDTLHAISRYFGLEPWMLLVPHLDPKQPPTLVRPKTKATAEA